VVISRSALGGTSSLCYGMLREHLRQAEICPTCLHRHDKLSHGFSFGSISLPSSSRNLTASRSCAGSPAESRGSARAKEIWLILGGSVWQGLSAFAFGCPSQCLIAITSRYSDSREVVPSVAELCAVQSISRSWRRAVCFSGSRAANALRLGP